MSNGMTFLEPSHGQPLPVPRVERQELSRHITLGEEASVLLVAGQAWTSGLGTIRSSMVPTSSQYEATNARNVRLVAP